MSEQRVTRRTVLGGTAAAAVGFAGCSGGGGTASGESGSTDEPTGTATSGGSTDAVEEYLSDVDNYDGIVDETGASEVTVTVGAEANGGNFGFGPAAIRVSMGTKVVWKWNGLGSTHNVVAEDGSFESKLVAEDGHTFSRTFEEPGTVEYYCTPHKTMGMKGVVVVE
ncbi:halocyanin domain-containing protein [Halobellus ruber]|uniref:Halocyanin domain-containing protein n=1 Tax=Halobellus ruber TaxID=2761102 RepID=A0A7J9SJN8_9EURY|nr:halocyanin domain-containing protein [Halobellus ruber]MBB6646246.1 halocyanin domain-containing protein [Halobellus ruber]